MPPEWNPYEPPSADVAPPAPAVAVARARVVAPATTWARAATVGLGLAVVVALVSLWIEWSYVEALQSGGRSDFDPTVLATRARWLQLAGIVDLVLYVATGICFLAWVAGASRTARSIVPALIRDTPTWTVAWWFIPIANLYKPYAGLRKIWNVTMIPSGVRVGESPPGLFLLWWGCFVARVVLFRLAAAMFNSKNVGDLITAAQVQMVGEVASCVAALAAIGVIRAIHAPQVKLARPRGR